MQPIEPVVEKHALSCVWCLVTLTQFSTCGGDHICIQQTELAASAGHHAILQRPRVPSSSSRRFSLAELYQPRNHDADHVRNCQSFSVCAAVQAAAVSRILAPVMMTLAKTSHMLRASQLLDTLNLCLQYHTFPQHKPCTLQKRPLVGYVSYERAREVVC